MVDPRLRQLLPEVQRTILERDIPIPGWRASPEEFRRFQATVAQIMAQRRLDRELGAGADLVDVAGSLARMMVGLGVLQPLIDVAQREEISEIMVRNGFVLVEQQGRIRCLGDSPFASEDHFWQIAHRAADLGGRVLKGDLPYVVVDLPDGSRFTALVPPLTQQTAINVRLFPYRMTMDMLVKRGSFEAPGEKTGHLVRLWQDLGEGEESWPRPARFLAEVARRNLASVLIGGEFGAGKTTLLSVLLQFVPMERVPVIALETFAEVHLSSPLALRVVVPEGRRDFPSMAEVMNIAVTRMRPGLLIVGEVTDPATARRFLEATNLGTRTWTTIHGNDALGDLYRLEVLAAADETAGGISRAAVREYTAYGVDLVVHLYQDPETGHRYVGQIAAVEKRLRGGEYQIVPLYEAFRSETLPVVDLWQRLEEQ